MSELIETLNINKLRRHDFFTNRVNRVGSNFSGFDFNVF